MFDILFNFSVLRTELPFALSRLILSNVSIETFPNPAPERDYVIQHIAEEFTSVCPKTGHPDFGTLVLTYIPDALCIELKAYKLFLQGFRNEGIFYEAVTNRIFSEVKDLLAPRWIRLESLWKPHGGIRSSLFCEEAKPSFEEPDVPFFGF